MNVSGWKVDMLARIAACWI